MYKDDFVTVLHMQVNASLPIIRPTMQVYLLFFVILSPRVEHYEMN